MWYARRLLFGCGVLSLLRYRGAELGMYAVGATPAHLCIFAQAGARAQQRTCTRKHRQSESDDSDFDSELGQGWDRDE
ncbi:hypothetical protein DFH07DRAFT_954802 [Mycena maculata]|uniref:Secreted protein n=1 Tax=Mycena maculata TaxID=230809 RepID=A0AAD7JNG4_9AGAR|nr:hypothetical protein DFH07DRAFT_954802 [Mycena maculata]